MPHTSPRLPQPCTLTAAFWLPTVSIEDRAERKIFFPQQVVMVDRLQILSSRQARRGVALLTALAILAAAIGIPLPEYLAKDTSRPFPCMHHACGCTTAESCWGGCCCSSDEQKLAWAREHRVAPPAEFRRQAAAAKEGCCSSGDCEEPAEPAAHWRMVRLDASRKCQGLSSLWLILGQALPPSEPDLLLIDLKVAARLAPPPHALVLSPAFEPATPPPRAAL